MRWLVLSHELVNYSVAARVSKVFDPIPKQPRHATVTVAIVMVMMMNGCGDDVRAEKHPLKITFIHKRVDKSFSDPRSLMILTQDWIIPSL